MFSKLNRRIRRVLVAAVLPVTMGLCGTGFGQLAPPSDPGYGPVAPAQPSNPGFGNDTPANVHPISGQFFNYVVPAGWQATESNTSIYVVSPDGGCFYGMTAVNVPSEQGDSPEQILQGVLQNAGLQNVQILGTTPANGGQGVTALIAFTTGNGTPCKAVVCLALGQTQNGPVGMLCFAGSRADQFETQARTLVSLAGQIQFKGPQPANTSGPSYGGPANGGPSSGSPSQPSPFN
jgi:hypothetical protein